MGEGRRTPEDDTDDRQQPDDRIEALARQIADIIKGAEPEQRQDLREYALGLIKEETEAILAPAAPGKTQPAADSSPLGMALLLGVMAVPMGLLFFPVGLTMLAVALVLGVIGVVSAMMRR